MLFLLFGTHLYFTFRLGFIQKRLPEGIRLSMPGKNRREGGEQLSSYAALSTALAATIGTGNIVGISTAIAVGGVGSVFWCWLTGFFGIATCYAECLLSVKYRVKGEDGTTLGGPMYVLERGLGQKWLAAVFSMFAVIASFGIGSSVQAHAIRAALEGQLEVSPHLIGIAAGVLAGLVIVGGNQKIAKVCTWLVPAMSVLYLGGCLFVIVKNREVLPDALAAILKGAFTPSAVTGGLAGRAVLTAMRTGISRGLFTNEAGLGSIPITAAAAGEPSAVRQGMISMTGPFWDTVVMCAITGIAMVGSMMKNPNAYEGVAADAMCFVTFRELPFGGEKLLAASLVLFAFATILGWNVYGTSAVRYLWGEKSIAVYQVCYMLSVYLGAVLSLSLVWGISDLFNSLMAVPNLIGVWMLRDVVVRETKRNRIE
ncbi:MAG: alanine/glycine:cation symporter family protein [Roseburia sp.]